MGRRALVCIMLAACGGGSTDIDATLVFADRTDAEIARLISAASGSDMFAAQAQVDSYSDVMEPCPAVAITGSTVTLTGGCTTLDGVTLEGTAAVTNPTSWDQIEFVFGEDTVYELTGWTSTQAGFTSSYDGVIRVSDFQVWDSDVTVTSLGVAVRSDIHYECGSSACDLEGSGVELVGVGGALASGSVAITSAGNASFTLRGKDRLTATISQGCVAWQIDGTDRQKVCTP